MESEKFNERPAIEAGHGQEIEYKGHPAKVLETFAYQGNAYPVIKHPAETPPELMETGTLGFDPKERVILMSGIPDAYKLAAYYNEIKCPDVLATPGACLAALKEESQFVPAEHQVGYFVWRKRFFAGVRDFCARMSANSNGSAKQQWDAYKNEMSRCVDYLEELNNSQK